MNGRGDQALLFTAIRLLLGIFFIASGIAKLLDVSAFVDGLGSYNLPDVVTDAATLVPAIEIMLGACLSLGLRPRLCAGAAAALLTTFTLLFAYGHYSKGVQDCGCFGAISALKTSPAVSFGRNLILIAVAIALCWNAPRANSLRLLSRWRYIVLALVGVIVFTAAGVSRHAPLWTPKNALLGKRLRDSALGKVVSVPQTGRFLVFQFNPKCPHCWDATNNVMAYKATGLVQDVIGLSVGTNEELGAYEAQFHPNFKTVLIDRHDFWKLTNSLPTVYYVVEGVITNIQTETIYGPQRFDKFVLHAGS